MGVTNNSLVRVGDVVNAGGVKNTFSSSVNGNKLIKDKDITKGTGTGSFVSPLFYNVTLKNEYGDTHLTKFQDLEIAKTYPVILKVSLPSTAWTGYTLYGFDATVLYPNGASNSNSINVKSLSTGTTIEIKNCCDNAKIKVSSSQLKDSGATISSDKTGAVPAKVEINSMFTEGNGVTCEGTLEYSCFTLTRDFGFIDPDKPIDPPVTGDSGTVSTRKIDIYISTENVSLYCLRIDRASYGTGSTLSEVENTVNPVTQVEILELITDKSGLPSSSMAVQATIEVPTDAYVAIYLSDPKGSANVSTAFAQYAWAENNYQYVSPGHKRTYVTYTISNFS